MAQVHDLLKEKGKQALVATAETDRQRKAIQAAAAYLGDENADFYFLFSGWALAGLPHRRIPDDKEWRVETDYVTLLVEPGRKALPNGTNPHVGVPYGSRARLIMLYLQSEALRTRRREIELGSSLEAWMKKLGITPGGKSRKEVREQAERISRCRLTFQMSRNGRVALLNQNILDTAMFVEETSDQRQGNLFLDMARLSEGFFEQLTKHPVPVEESAIQQLNNNSMALDVYCWLAYRLHSLAKPTQISWTAIRQQFGAGFKKNSHFKPSFADNLELACAVYPDAKLETNEQGLLLYPSPPPVPKTMIGLGGTKALNGEQRRG